MRLCVKKNKGGRPRKVIDYDQFEKLCYLQCTQAEIMNFFDIDTRDTLNERIREHYGKDESYSTIYDKKSAGGKIAVRRKQFQVAESGNVSMLIWLGKQWLGQTDKVETDNTQKVIGITISQDDSNL